MEKAYGKGVRKRRTEKAYGKGVRKRRTRKGVREKNRMSTKHVRDVRKFVRRKTYKEKRESL